MAFRNTGKQILLSIPIQQLKNGRYTSDLIKHYYLVSAYVVASETHVENALMYLKKILQKLVTSEVYSESDRFVTILKLLNQLLFDAGRLTLILTGKEEERNFLLADGADYIVNCLKLAVRDVFSKYERQCVTADKMNEEQFILMLNQHILEQELSKLNHLKKTFLQVRKNDARETDTEELKIFNLLITAYESAVNTSTAFDSIYTLHSSIRGLVKDRKWKPNGVRSVDREITGVLNLYDLHYMLGMTLMDNRKLDLNVKKDKVIDVLDFDRR